MSTFGWLRRRHLGTEADRATFRTLHTASSATPALRAGLTKASAERAARHLRSLLGAPAVALTDTTDMLAWDGHFQHHALQTMGLARRVIGDGATTVHSRADIPCSHARCSLRQVVVTPLTVEERVVGTLQVFTPSASAGRARGAGAGARGGSGPRGGPGGAARRGRGRAMGLGTAGARGAGRVPDPADGGRGASAPGPDQSSFRLQLVDRDRVLRPDRSRARPRAAAGVRRVHALLLPQARRVQ